MSLVLCSDLPDYVRNDCPDFLLTGISAIAALKFDHTIVDMTDAGQWTTAIAAGDVTIIGSDAGFKGVWTPSEITTTNPAAKGSDIVLRGWAHELAVTDADVSATNDTFYQSLNNFKGYIAIYYCHENQIRYFATPTNFAIGPPANTDGKEIQRYSGLVRWETAQDDFGALTAAPAGIF